MTASLLTAPVTYLMIRRPCVSCIFFCGFEIKRKGSGMVNEFI